MHLSLLHWNGTTYEGEGLQQRPQGLLEAECVDAGSAGAVPACTFTLPSIGQFALVAVPLGLAEDAVWSPGVAQLGMPAAWWV